METDRVLALKEGDYETFKQVFEDFWEKVFTYLLKKTKDTETAKDLSQQVFIKLWKYRHQLSCEISLNEQLFRKSKQVFIDWLRQELRKPLHVREGNHYADLLYTKCLGTELEIKNDVNRALSTLPPKRKQIFELKYIHGYSYKEIARMLGISTKTVDNQLLKAMQHLRKVLQVSVLAATAMDMLQQINLSTQ